MGRTAGLAGALLSIVSAGYYLLAPAGAFDPTSGSVFTIGLFALVVLLTALVPAHLLRLNAGAAMFRARAERTRSDAAWH